jgi:chlorobactene glucosyltransferase
MLWVMLVLLGFHLLSLAVVVKVRRDMPSLSDPALDAPAGELPLLSVVMPMRNEESNAADVLECLLAQDHPHFEVVVVNDQSTDRTGAILAEYAARDERIRIVEGQDLPADWRGKNFALHQGCSNARGEHLLLLDADVRLGPQALRRSVQAMLSRGASMFTLLPRLVTGSFWEHVVQTALFQLFITWLPVKALEDPKNDFALANGPFILLTREAYAGIGGHEALKAEIAEDFVMAQKLKAASFKLTYWEAVEHASLRMYETFGALWQGWTKNFYFGLGKSVLLAAFFVLAIAFYFLLPYVALAVFVAEMIGWGVSLPMVLLTAAAVATILCQTAVRRLFQRYYGVSPRHQWTEPLGFTIIVLLIVNSFYRYLVVGKVEWRGRSHRVDA